MNYSNRFSNGYYTAKTLQPNHFLLDKFRVLVDEVSSFKTTISLIDSTYNIEAWATNHHEEERCEGLAGCTEL